MLSNFDTYGFPLELTQEMAGEQGFSVDTDGFSLAMEGQRQRARSARQETEYISEQGHLFKQLREELGETNFVGYQTLAARAGVLGILRDGQRLQSAEAGEEIAFILDVTPCYAESGGQVGDHGRLTAPDLDVEIYEVTRPVENLIVHRGRVTKGVLREHDQVTVEVETAWRAAVCRNHSATHLLHKALKMVLGEHVNQAGSLVEPGRLRFDFTHYSAAADELKN